MKVFSQALLEYVHIVELFNLPTKKFQKLLSDRASPNCAFFDFFNQIVLCWHHKKVFVIVQMV